MRVESQKRYCAAPWLLRTQPSTINSQPSCSPALRSARTIPYCQNDSSLYFTTSRAIIVGSPDLVPTMPLLLKRLATAIVLFGFIFVVVYFAICIVGGAVSGAVAGAGQASSQDSYETGRQAGANFVKHNLLLIVLSSFVSSLIASLVLSFSGVLPWCRKLQLPPSL